MTPIAIPPRGFLDRIVRLRRDVRGIAAVEFALVLPILVAFYLGLTELQPGISIKRKLSLVTRTLADLTTRSAGLTTDELKNIFGASVAIMRPYDDNNVTQMVVSSIAVTKVGENYVGSVEWSCPWNLKTKPTGSDLVAKVKGAAYTVPTGFRNDATKSFVVVDTQYPYTPNIGYKITGTVVMNDTTPWPVRDAERVPDPGCPTKS